MCLLQSLTLFLKSDVGVTSIEYALIGSLVAIIIIASVQGVGEQILGLFTTVQDAFPG